VLSGPVISLSLPKSGTTTLARALQAAGLRVADWRIRPRQTEDPDLRRRLVAPILYEDYFTHGDPLRRLSDFDAVTEMSAVNRDMSFWPQCDAGLIAAIEAHHPGVRFVLSLRAPEAVAQSMLGWNNLGTRRLPGNDIPGLPRPYGRTAAELARWVAGHHAFCTRLFDGRDNFLTYRLEDPDAPRRIGDFLGLELPWWGTANANPKNAEQAS
jgi:hypothetical protein